jgi:hypothetical protein
MCGLTVLHFFVLLQLLTSDKDVTSNTLICRWKHPLMTLQVLPEKLIAAQLTSESFEFYGSRGFILSVSLTSYR